MRALSRSEQSHVAGGRKFNPVHVGAGAGATPDLKKAPPGPGGTDPGVEVVGYVFDAPPGGFSSWWAWDAMNTFYWEAVPGGGVGGSGGGATNDQPIAYNDGTHNVYATTATSTNGHNNPGDIMHKNSQGEYVLNTYATEQDGLDALATLMDDTTYDDMQIQNMGNTYAPDSQAHPHQSENWENNVETYMANHGYSNAGTQTPSEMGNAEFNTFLNAISVAEGNTDMG